MPTVSPDSVAQDQIKAFIERIERLEEERKAIAGDIAEVYAEAKGNGFDRKALKAVVRIRAMDHDARMEHETLVALYLSALGMASLPTFDDEDDRPSHVHVHMHTREDEPDHDPETGEIIEPLVETPVQTEPAGEPAPSSNAGTEAVEGPATVVQEASEAIEVHTLDQAGSTPAPATTLPVEPPADVTGKSGGGSKPPSAPVDRSKPNPWCMDPEECGVEASWNYQCLKCKAVQAGRERAGAMLQ